MNLKMGEGKVPVWVGGDTPYMLVKFPSKTIFFDLYARRVSKEHLVKYWDILKARSKGASLSDAGYPYGLTKERVRQIEAKFLRLFSEHHWRVRSSSTTDSQRNHRPADDNH